MSSRHLAEEKGQLNERMLAGDLSDGEIMEAIILLREKGEASVDIFEYLKAINRRRIPVSMDRGLLDICGTGGNGLNRFNVSAASAFVISVLGATFLGYGNRGSQKPNGSFDLLEALGITIEQTPKKIEKTISETNIGFVHSQHFGSSLRSVAAVRKMDGEAVILVFPGHFAI